MSTWAVRSYRLLGQPSRRRSQLADSQRAEWMPGRSRARPERRDPQPSITTRQACGAGGVMAIALRRRRWVQLRSSPVDAQPRGGRWVADRYQHDLAGFGGVSMSARTTRVTSRAGHTVCGNQDRVVALAAAAVMRISDVASGARGRRSLLRIRGSPVLRPPRMCRRAHPRDTGWGRTRPRRMCRRDHPRDTGWGRTRPRRVERSSSDTGWGRLALGEVST